jgi:hypothetical protein
MTGETAVDVKKRVMLNNPAIRKSRGRSLPNENARKRKAGDQHVFLDDGI